MAPALAASLTARQDAPPSAAGFPNTLGTITPVPATYGSLYTSPGAGAVAGIVLGSVVGFLLLLALLYSCCAFGPVADTASSWGAPTAITLRTRAGGRSTRPRGHGRHRSSSRHHTRTRISETVEMRTTSSAPPQIRRASTSRQHHHHHQQQQQQQQRPIVVDGRSPPSEYSDMEEEEIVTMRDGRRRSMSARPIAVPVPAPRAVPESDSEDEVVVVEEHDPHRRRRSSSRRASGGLYRDRDRGRDPRRYSRG